MTDGLRVLVVSDTHVPDFAKRLPDQLLEEARHSDLILHAGDVTSASILDELAACAPVHIALGNNDGADVKRWGARNELHLDLEGVRLAMIHDSGPSRGREARMRRRFPDARVVVFGHSHIPIDTEIDGQRLFNPGSPTWKRRQPRPTYGRLHVRSGGVNSEIVEL